MIGVFPDPYPDELLYSVVSRYYDRLQYPNSGLAFQELVGPRAATAVIDVPGNLRDLVAALPADHGYTVDHLIHQHTLFPYYCPFLPPARANALLEAMRGTIPASPRALVGLQGNAIQSPRWLRFCPLCAESDERQVGERYWHRLHQVPGVEVCPTHAVWLESSHVSARYRRQRDLLCSAERFVPRTAARPLQRLNRLHRRLLWLAIDVTWLFEQEQWLFDLDMLRRRYVSRLIERRLASYSGRINWVRLRQAFLNCFPYDLLVRLNCDLQRSKDHPWLSNLLRQPTQFHHPLHHFLLMQFLETPASTFFEHAWVPYPFGLGPWPCLNAGSDHYRERCVTFCQIHYNSRRLMGIFSCSCGFIYARIGPDRVLEDTYRISHVIARGPVWEACVHALLKKPGMNTARVARQLGIAATTLQTLLRRRQPTCEVFASSQQAAAKPRVVQNVGRDAARLPYDGTLPLACLDRVSRPQAVGTPARPRQMSSGARGRPEPKPEEWAHRDVAIAAAIHDIGIRLRNNPILPLRISRSAVLREVTSKTCLQRHLTQLPRSAQALQDVVESLEAFAVRRVWWMAAQFREAQICPARWRLERRAGLTTAMRQVPEVRAAVSAALDSLCAYRAPENTDTLPLS